MTNLPNIAEHGRDQYGHIVWVDEMFPDDVRDILVGTIMMKLTLGKNMIILMNTMMINNNALRNISQDICDQDCSLIFLLH